jgi:hypothetical protein
MDASKIKKEQPQYKVQIAYESNFKKNYRKMLASMNKTLILKLTQNVK